MQPKIELIPGKAAIPSGIASSLDILVKITPPAPEVHFVRPRINLGLVLDRSGSMAGGKKMAHARQAAIFAVSALLPDDRVSVTIFDNHVETIFANELASDKPSIVKSIEGIQTRGATALHAGWKEGADQVEHNHVSSGLNRVILLSDGQANEGVTDPNVISAECKSRTDKGVSTTTMGLGEDYNEDLMEKMAESGDGNYYFIETPDQLTDIFHTELKGLMANVGSKVSLGIEPQSASTVSEVYNGMDRNSFGRLMLPNLCVGMPIQVVLRLNVPALTGESEVCRFRLAWDDPKTGDRLFMYAGLVMPSAPNAEWEAMPADSRVVEQIAYHNAAKAKKEAVAAFDRGDISSSKQFIARGMASLDAHAFGTTQSGMEMDALREIAAQLDSGSASFRKSAQHQMYLKKRGSEGPPKTDSGEVTSS
jgi:Ca-activated chloride channel family protein